MKINDVIKKCIKIPGISIKQAEYSMELILNTKEGKGSMTFFSLFPGLSLAYIFINSPTWTAPDLRSDSCSFSRKMQNVFASFAKTYFKNRKRTF